ncbi:glycosyltransferase [Croceibacterium mercuriale]|uniref:glycosyltransferase n=1 Tax=Croceibacterium mercuriale TaxID=1572751 RepID=UPI00068C9587|nr:glycosyltransferase [Croceibacterium mercuriale]
MAMQYSHNRELQTNAGQSASPRFSVVIPAYNAANYIEATLRSVARQDFPGVEVIIMDGGSSDNTVELARNFPDLEALVISEKDRGQLDAVQKAIASATGDILHWLNADDIMMPGTLRAVDREFSRDANLDLVFSDDFAFDESARQLVNGSLIKGLTFKDHSLFYRQMYSECIFWKRSRTRLLPEKDFDLRLCTDYAFFLNLRYGLKEKWVAKRLGAFRIAAGQISQIHGDKLAGEQLRIRAAAYRQAGWSESSIHWRTLLHAPSFWLRQVARPRAAALLRATSRFLDRNARREAQTAAFFDRWLDPQAESTSGLEKLLFR